MQNIREIEKEIIVRSDGLLENKYTGLLYQKISDTEVLPLISPRSGAFLLPNSDGTFHTDYDDATYIIGKNNNIIPQIDPYSRGELKNIDGRLISKYTGQEFTYDEAREAYIPHYIPDDSSEPAHIEGDFLVGDTTGRRFQIDQDGTILTPQEEYFREQKRQEAERFKQMEENGSLEEYFSKRTVNIPKVEKTPLQLYLENIKNHPETVTNEDLENLTILMQKGELPEEVMKKIEEKYAINEEIKTSIKDFLKDISNEEELCTYLNKLGFPSLNLSLLHQLDNNFFWNLFQVDEKATIQIIKNESNIQINISTALNSPLSTEIILYRNGSISTTKFHHDPLLVNNIRTGLIENFQARRSDNGSLIVIEDTYQLKLHSKENLSMDANAERKEIIVLPDGTIKQGEPKKCSTLCFLSHQQYLEPISNTNDTNPIEMDEAYKKMAALRRLGFQEKYFQKEKVAGLSYDLEGAETYLENEFDEIEKEINTVYK